MQVDKKKLYILLGVIAVIIVVIVAAIQTKKVQNSQPVTIPTVTQATSTEEVAPSKNAVDTATVTPEVLKESVAVASGTSLITKDNKVVTAEGTPVKLKSKLLLVLTLLKFLLVLLVLYQIASRLKRVN